MFFRFYKSSLSKWLVKRKNFMFHYELNIWERQDAEISGTWNGFSHHGKLLSLLSVSVQFVGTIWLHLFTISPIAVPLVQFHISCSRILLWFTGQCANYTSISVRFYNKNNHNSNNTKNQLQFTFLLWSMLRESFFQHPMSLTIFLMKIFS